MHFLFFFFSCSFCSSYCSYSCLPCSSFLLPLHKIFIFISFSFIFLFFFFPFLSVPSFSFLLSSLFLLSHFYHLYLIFLPIPLLPFLPLPLLSLRSPSYYHRYSSWLFFSPLSSSFNPLLLASSSIIFLASSCIEISSH